MLLSHPATRARPRFLLISHRHSEGARLVSCCYRISQSELRLGSCCYQLRNSRTSFVSCCYQYAEALRALLAHFCVRFVLVWAGGKCPMSPRASQYVRLPGKAGAGALRGPDMAVSAGAGEVPGVPAMPVNATPGARASARRPRIAVIASKGRVASCCYRWRGRLTRWQSRALITARNNGPLGIARLSARAASTLSIEGFRTGAGRRSVLGIDREAFRGIHRKEGRPCGISVSEP